MSNPWGRRGRYVSHQGSEIGAGLAGEAEEKEDWNSGFGCARSIRQCAPVVQPVSNEMSARANRAPEWIREMEYASGLIMPRI